MSENGLYIPEQDARYANPVIDLEEWRDKPCRHYFVHGEFQGTEQDKILFALQNGAYYIASNQGEFSVPLGERCYQANAQTAVFCRKLAQRIYG
ncbi:MAG: hypothetical protein Q4C31_12580 [Eubacteriales bacterium]|nr:hypothetical protein [Eubacteriales bacterium]